MSIRAVRSYSISLKGKRPTQDNIDIYFSIYYNYMLFISYTLRLNSRIYLSTRAIP